MNKQKNPIEKLKLLITIVDQRKTDFYLDVISTFHINYQFVSYGYGTVNSTILDLLGMQNDKGVIFSIGEEKNIRLAMQEVEKKFNTIKRGKGVSFMVPLSSVIGVQVYKFLLDKREWDYGIWINYHYC